MHARNRWPHSPRRESHFHLDNSLGGSRRDTKECSVAVAGAVLRPLREAAFVAEGNEGPNVADHCRDLSAALLSTPAAHL